MTGAWLVLTILPLAIIALAVAVYVLTGRRDRGTAGRSRS